MVNINLLHISMLAFISRPNYTPTYSFTDPQSGYRIFSCYLTIICEKLFFSAFFSRWTTRSSIEHTKSRRHLHAVLKSWPSRSTFKAHAHHSAMRTKLLCSSSLLMMSLTKTLSVPLQRPEGNPWQNISTTTEPVG